MIANRYRQDFLCFLLFDNKPVQMRLDVARQQMKLEFLVLRFRGLFILLCDRRFRFGNCRNRDTVAEVLFHELRNLGLQLFRRRKLWWWWVLCHVTINIESKRLRGNAWSRV